MSMNWGQKSWGDDGGVQQQKEAISQRMLFSTHGMPSNCCLGDRDVAWNAGWQCCSLIHGFLEVIIAVPAVLGLYSDMKVSQ